jgi:predicted nucleotidyltransferase
MKLTKQKINQLRVYFAQQPAVERVHLFGSFAREEADKNSDIDLLVN